MNWKKGMRYASPRWTPARRWWSRMGRQAPGRLAGTVLVASITGCGAVPQDPPHGLHGLPQATLERVWVEGGADDPEYAFESMVGMIRGPDGELWSWGESEPVIRRWTAEGRPRSVVGQAGEGPGEFRSVILGTLGPAPGDSIWVLDLELGRVTFLGWDGEVRSVRSAGPAGPAAFWDGSRDPANWAPPIGLLADGSLHRRTTGFGTVLDPDRVPRIVHLREDRGLDTLAVIAVRPSAVFEPSGPTGQRITQQPYLPPVLEALSPDRTSLVILDQAPPASAGTAYARLVRVALRPGGDTLADAWIPYHAEPIPEAEVDAVLDRVARNATSGPEGVRFGSESADVGSQEDVRFFL